MNRRSVGDCRRQACDRRVLVNVLDRHCWQVRPLTHPRAEPSHHHRVRAKIIKEVAVDRHPLHTHDLSQHVCERALERHRRGDWHGVGECRRQASDRGVLVNILDRHRRQIRPLPHPSAEPSHHHRVRTKIIKEVAVDRHPLHTHDLSQHVCECALRGRLRASTSVLRGGRISQHFGEGALGGRLRERSPASCDGRISQHTGEGALGT